MGFGEHQFAEMEEHRKRNNFTDIEFRRDPETHFYSVVCGSERSKAEYMKSREFTDQNSRNGGGQAISAKDIRDACEILGRVADKKKRKSLKPSR